MVWDGKERRLETRDIGAGLDVILLEIQETRKDVKETKEDVKVIFTTLHGNGGEPGLKTEVALNTDYRENVQKERTNRKTNLYVMIAAILTAVVALVVALNGG